MKFYRFDRTEPLKIFDDPNAFQGEESKTEYEAECLGDEEFVFALAVKTDRDGEEIGVKTALVCGGAVLEGRTASFVTEGVTKFGERFFKTVKLSADAFQPLYIGVDTTGLSGSASLLITIEGDRIEAVRVRLKISERKAIRMGDDDPTRLSRLRWLDSREAADDRVSKRYTPVGREGRTLKFIGRTVTLSEAGLPESAVSYFEKNATIQGAPQAQYFDGGISIDFAGETFKYSEPVITARGDNAALSSEWESERIRCRLDCEIKYEGAFFYRLTATAKEDYAGEVAMRARFGKDASRYDVGLGMQGGAFRAIDFKWNPAHQDALFVGDVNAGLRIKWKAETYVRPLVNVYYKAQPLNVPDSTWANGGKGGIKAETRDGKAVVTARTGAYRLRRGESRKFDFELHFTPFEPIDKERQFGVRYYHTNRFGKIEKEVATAKKHGLNNIVVHHGNGVHPLINYPFVEREAMEKLIRSAHAEGIGVKFYDTVREASNHMAELYAYKAMGDEIILRKRFEGEGWKGRTSPELEKYFGDEIVAAWRVPLKVGKYKGQTDAALIVRPDSRLDNYYIEGLKYLTEVFGIDGVYIDDTALDRSVLERARKIFDRTDGLIDMHMWNHFEERAGMASCVNLYTEIFPFLDSLWIGEGFDVKKLPADYLLTEVSGLTYGKPSQMLEGGGDPFTGMLYAMNNRYGWGVRTADRIYRLWDDFKIETAEMRGYWDEKNPFCASDDDVKVTAYLKDDAVLLAAYNFAETAKTFALKGVEGYMIEKPKVKGIQSERRVDAERLKLKGRSGAFYLLKKR